MIKASQIAAIINEALDGVERSKLGKIEIKNEEGKNTIAHLPFQTYLKVLDSILPKNIGMDIKDGSH